MSDKKLNMRAYYHTFESTGEMGADRILSAVASAGKSAHNTADWDEEWKNIQSAAVETAGEIAELKQRLAAAEAKITQWIPISERLPNPGSTILAVDNSGDMGVCTFVNAKFVGECLGFEVYLNDGGWDRSPSKVTGEYVTHWMPLLEPPESGKGE